MADKTPPSPPPPAKRRKTLFQRVIDNKNAEREKMKSRIILGAAYSNDDSNDLCDRLMFRISGATYS